MDFAAAEGKYEWIALADILFTAAGAIAQCVMSESDHSRNRTSADLRARLDMSAA